MFFPSYQMMVLLNTNQLKIRMIEYINNINKDNINLLHPYLYIEYFVNK